MDGMSLFRSKTRLLHLYPKAHSFQQLSPLTWVITYSTCIRPTLGHSHQELICCNNSHLKPLPRPHMPFNYCPISLVPCQEKTNENLKNSLSSLSPILSFHSPLNSFQLGFHPFHSTETVLSGSPLTTNNLSSLDLQYLTWLFSPGSPLTSSSLPIPLASPSQSPYQLLISLSSNIGSPQTCCNLYQHSLFKRFCLILWPQTTSIYWWLISPVWTSSLSFVFTWLPSWHLHLIVSLWHSMSYI